jgi:hypothetical protein
VVGRDDADGVKEADEGKRDVGVPAAEARARRSRVEVVVAVPFAGEEPVKRLIARVAGAGSVPSRKKIGLVQRKKSLPAGPAKRKARCEQYRWNQTVL